jgi:hypothetical protein
MENDERLTTFYLYLFHLTRTNVQEHHAKQYQRQVKGLCAKVLFVEEHGSKQEADDD